MDEPLPNWDKTPREYMPGDLPNLRQDCEDFYNNMPPDQQQELDEQVAQIQLLDLRLQRPYGPIPHLNEFVGATAQSGGHFTQRYGLNIFDKEQTRFGHHAWMLLKNYSRAYRREKEDQEGVGGEAADQALSRELVMKQALLGLRCGLKSGSVIACVPENRVCEFVNHVRQHLRDNDGELHEIFYVDLPPFANTWPFHPQATPMLIVSMDLIRRAEIGHGPEVTPENSYRLLAFRHADIFNNDLNATLINHVEEVIPECVVGIKPLLASMIGENWDTGFHSYLHPMSSWAAAEPV